MVGGCLFGGTLALTGAAKMLEYPPFTPPHTIDDRLRHRVDPQAISDWPTPRAEVALTFDDGPDPEYTPTVLAALKAANAAATFFLIGRNALKYPDLVSQILEEGHEVANHTMDHLWLDESARSIIADEIDRGEAALGGKTAGRFFRPPRGWTSPEVVHETQRRGLQTIFWGISFEGHQAKGVSEATGIIIDSAHNGAIVACHDGGTVDGPNPQTIDRSRTVRAVPAIIEGIQAKGLTPVTLSTLMA